MIRGTATTIASAASRNLRTVFKGATPLWFKTKHSFDALSRP
jgi:hypothetical protein